MQGRHGQPILAVVAGDSLHYSALLHFVTHCTMHLSKLPHRWLLSQVLCGMLEEGDVPDRLLETLLLYLVPPKVKQNPAAAR